MTDFMPNEPLWVVYPNIVVGAVFVQHTAWVDHEGVPLIETSAGLTSISNVYKYMKDAQQAFWRQKANQ